MDKLFVFVILFASILLNSFGQVSLKYGMNAYGSVDSDDLKSSFEQVSGKDLSSFFFQWIFEDDVPEVNCRIDLTQPSQNFYQYSIEFNQMQNSTRPFFLPIELKFLSLYRDTVLSFRLINKNQIFNISLPFIAERVEFDPNQKLLLIEEVIF